MKNIVLHIAMLCFVLLTSIRSMAQSDTIKYVELNSIHALSVPENNAYSFMWEVVSETGNVVYKDSAGCVTDNINWNELATYYVTVYPILDSVDCPGEPKVLYVIVVQDMSLHAFDDYFYTLQNVPITDVVSANDFDDSGAELIYNPTLASDPAHGTVTLDPFGQFTYTPDNGYIGTDFFTYSVCNDNDPQMCDNAVVTVVVGPRSGSADVKVDKIGPLKAVLGGKIEYKLVVTNLGPQTAKQVILRDIVPFGVFDPEYSYQGQAFETWNDSISIGDLASNDSVTLYIRGDISLYSPDILYNQGLVYTDNVDNDHLNNDSIWITHVLPIYVESQHLTVASCDTQIFVVSGESVHGIKSYKWEPATNLSNPNIASPVFYPDTAGVYEFVFTITDSLDYTASDTIFVTVPEVVEAIVPDTFYIDLGETDVISAAESKGVDLSFYWTTSNPTYDNGIVSGERTANLSISRIGTYYLEVIDKYGCKSNDSVIVLLESWPPVANADSIYIVAGTKIVLPNNGSEYLALSDNPKAQYEYLHSITDTSFNLLDNDEDINDFTLNVSNIITYPKNYDVFVWEETGEVVMQPKANFFGVDSLEYEVCNNGFPEKCSTAWAYINSLRPPLNADLEITKTQIYPEIHNGKFFAFRGDTIEYKLTIVNNGPDTAMVNVYDHLGSGLDNALFSFDGGTSWLAWNGYYNFTQALLPESTGDYIEVLIKAYVNHDTQRDFVNKAWVFSSIVENDANNDTSTIITTVKELVIARAGGDIAKGSCHPSVQLDASIGSTGENLTYQWKPSTYLSNANIANPVCTATSTITYELTITDDDGFQSVDSVTVYVLPTPIARAGEDLYVEVGVNASPNGSASSGAFGLNPYRWEAFGGGSIIAGSSDYRCVTDTSAFGGYILTVTDSVGCIDIDTMYVYQKFLDPIAVPDYYSVAPGGSVSGNLIANDFDPNVGSGFVLSAVPQTVTTANGIKVTINADGTFTYQSDRYKLNRDEFTYTVCINAEPPRCATGYVIITVQDPSENQADLNIHKTVTTDQVLVGQNVTWVLTIENNGPAASGTFALVDSLSEFLENATYYTSKNSNVYSWTGRVNNLPSLSVGESMTVSITAKVRSDAPSVVYNAATVAGNVYDPCTDWDNVDCRNVDTASVAIASGIIAGLRTNLTNIGECFSSRSQLILDASHDVTPPITSIDPSINIDDITVMWSPEAYVQTYSETKFKATIKEGLSDTTVTFSITLFYGERISSASVRVYIAPKVIANAGIDRKMNDGEPLILDGSESEGLNLKYYWTSSSGATNSDKNSPLWSITSTGTYTLRVVDAYSCESSTFVTIRTNNLHAVDDVALLVEGHNFVGNVAWNDFDPDGDSVYFKGTVQTLPQHGYLVPFDTIDRITPSIIVIGNTSLIYSPYGSPAALGGSDTITDRRYISHNGTYIYVPDSGFVGYDYFNYTVCDNNDPDKCLSSTVHIFVLDVDSINTPPVAVPETYFVVKNSDGVSSNVALNDFDIDGNNIYVRSTAVATPTKGSVAISTDRMGDITYVSRNGQTGTDAFRYQLLDNGSPVRYDTGFVDINIYDIESENHRPVANDDAFFTVEKPIDGYFLDNDYDPDAENTIYLSVNIVMGPFNGELKVDPLLDGGFTYTPNSGFEGTDWFVYEICDDDAYNRLCDYATVYIANLKEERYITDVSIAKTGSPEAVSSGTVEYTLTVTDNGPTFVNDVVVYDTLDALLSNAEYSVDGGVTWSEWNNSYYIERMDIDESIDIMIRADLPLDIDTSFANIAWVWHDMVERDSTNNRDSVSTRVFQRVVADAGPDTIIEGCTEGFMLDARASVGMDSNSIKYSWSPASYLDDPFSATPMFTPDMPGEYTFMVIASNEHHGFVGSDTDYVTITVVELPVADLGNTVNYKVNGQPRIMTFSEQGGHWAVFFNDIIDPTLTVTLSGSTSTSYNGELSYKWWRISSNGVLYDSLSNTSTLTVTNRRNGYYWLKVYDDFGCVDSIDIWVGFGNNCDDEVLATNTFEVYQQTTDTVDVLKDYQLDFENEDELDLLSVITPPVHGTAKVINDTILLYTPEDYYCDETDSLEFIVITKNGCSSTGWARIYVHCLPPLVPLGFSPNGDGVNETLIIENIDYYPNNTFRVFNRWGNLVYTKDRYTNSEPWDGVANKGLRIGKNVLPTASYMFMLDVGDLNSDVRNDKYRLTKGYIYVVSGK